MKITMEYNPQTGELFDADGKILLIDLELVHRTQEREELVTFAESEVIRLMFADPQEVA